jgi:DnaB-like helicase C terminal domain
MKPFKFGYHHIDKHVSFRKSDLIVIASYSGMGLTTFALNIMKRNANHKGCYISLFDTKEKIDFKLGKMDKAYGLISKLKDFGIETLNQNPIESHHLEFPALIELIEYIVHRKDDFDYFIVDGMTDIDTGINPLASENKNYQYILRHLKAISVALDKNIVLLSNIYKPVEEEHRFSYRKNINKEKYIDFILTLYRPEYYGVVENELGEEYQKGETILFLAKSREPVTGLFFNLTFDWRNFLFT